MAKKTAVAYTRIVVIDKYFGFFLLFHSKHINFAGDMQVLIFETKREQGENPWQSRCCEPELDGANK